jgi:hypothetical protein
VTAALRRPSPSDEPQAGARAYSRRMGWRSTRRGAAIALVVVLALAAGARAPSAADAAVTFGSTLPAPSAGFYDSCDQPCTAAQVELPGAKTRSPVDGTIVRFRLRTGAGSDAQQVKFRVLRSSDGVNFIGAGTSAAFNLPTTAGITEFPVNMPVRTGDYVGIDLPGGSKRAVIIAQNAGAFQAGWFPTLADSGAARPSGNPRGSEPTVFDVLLQADVEPSSTPSPTPPAAPVALNCTSSRQVATCPDPSQPAMCGPTSLGFPQCSLPLSLPTVCSGTGTGTGLQPARQLRRGLRRARTEPRSLQAPAGERPLRSVGRRPPGYGRARRPTTRSSPAARAPSGCLPVTSRR